MKKGGLGRGLSALIPEGGATSPGPSGTQADPPIEEVPRGGTPSAPGEATAAPSVPVEASGVADDLHLEMVAVSASSQIATSPGGSSMMKRWPN